MKYVVVLSVCLFAASVIAQDAKLPTHEGSEELQKIKGLVGTWVGEMDHGQGPQKVQIVYRVTAAGSAVVETFNPGTPMEMVTVYHDQKGKLAMTHYCMLGNQPRMKLTDSADNRISLDLANKKAFGQDEMHMHSLIIDFVDTDKIRQTWALYAGDKEVSAKPMDLTRKPE